MSACGSGASGKLLHLSAGTAADVELTSSACAFAQAVANRCQLCREITDDGLLALGHLQRLQTLVLNAMSQRVSGSFLSRLQGN